MNTEKSIMSTQINGETFLHLISEKKIVIPKIQRDYAQGRQDSKSTEIRDSFLSSIIDVLDSNQEEKLVLDFIYGSTKEKTLFVPLDGQQRLTTLFLLHWFLIPKDKLFLLGTKTNNSSISHFSYETRISSKDFCDYLVSVPYFDLKGKVSKRLNEIDEIIFENQANPSLIKDLEISKKTTSLSSIIKNESKFKWSWRKDPTIKGMLVMIDELELRLGNQEEESIKLMWNRLENGKIVFHLLPLEQFNLSDELYVKMNARGKELSDFDILKSTLEEQMMKNNVDQEIQDLWRKNFDSNWIDLFWNKTPKLNSNENITIEKYNQFIKKVEDGYLRFLKRMMVYHIFLNDNCVLFDWENENIKRYIPFSCDKNNVVNKIREFSIRNDVLKLVPFLCKTNFFNDTFFKFIKNSIESIIVYDKSDKRIDASELVDKIYFDVNPKSIFEAFIDDNITYDVRVQFFAILEFFKYNNVNDIFENNSLKREFNFWMRIIRNLSTNSNTYYYNGYDDFLKSIKTIQKWTEEVYNHKSLLSINQFISDQDNKLDGFDGKQLEEEKIKAKLIVDEKWEAAFYKAEEHKYFLGQIRFLLNWSKEEAGYNLEVFNAYLNKILYVFDSEGLKPELSSPTYCFRNALMVNIENYLLSCSFVIDKTKDRDRSWKSYFRDNEKSKNIKKLLDIWDQEIQPDFLEFCKCECENKKNNIVDWRRCFINKPEIYDICKKDEVYWNKGNVEIFLLESSTNWVGNNIYRELNTYYWYLKFSNYNGWKSFYNNSQQQLPLLAIFTKENHKIKVSFERNGDLWKYSIKSSYNPNNLNFIYLNEFWNIVFDTTEYIEVESILKMLLN